MGYRQLRQRQLSFGLLSLVLIADYHHVVALIFQKKTNMPNLQHLAPQIYKTKLNYRVAFGDKETPFTMNGLHVQLESDNQVPKTSSTGIHMAELLTKPWYIKDEGQCLVELENGGWEIGWNPESPHGILTCSFYSQNEIQRNENAKMEAGRFFINHRVWTKQTLQSERQRRLKIQEYAAKHLAERDQRIKEIVDDESNMGSKVVSYAQAAQARNKYFKSGHRESLYVPLYDDQVLELTPDCIVSTRGEIFKMDYRKRPQKIGLSRLDFLEEETDSQ